MIKSITYTLTDTFGFLQPSVEIVGEITERDLIEFAKLKNEVMLGLASEIYQITKTK